MRVHRPDLLSIMGLKSNDAAAIPAPSCEAPAAIAPVVDEPASQVGTTPTNRKRRMKISQRSKLGKITA